MSSCSRSPGSVAPASVARERRNRSLHRRLLSCGLNWSSWAQKRSSVTYGIVTSSPNTASAVTSGRRSSPIKVRLAATAELTASERDSPSASGDARVSDGAAGHDGPDSAGPDSAGPGCARAGCGGAARGSPACDGPGRSSPGRCSGARSTQATASASVAPAFIRARSWPLTKEINTGQPPVIDSRPVRSAPVRASRDRPVVNRSNAWSGGISSTAIARASAGMIVGMRVVINRIQRCPPMRNGSIWSVRHASSTTSSRRPVPPVASSPGRSRRRPRWRPAWSGSTNVGRRPSSTSAS